jgi:hypothetical protein
MLVNEVKGIFGIPHCLFLVSVSEDVLSVFERPRIPSVGCVRSAFTQILRVDHLDIRTGGDPAQVRRSSWHLLTCAWLDLEDSYQIRTVGLATARRDSLVTWPVTELAELLLCGRDPDTARDEFRALAQRVLTSAGLTLPRRNDNAVIHQQRVCTITETEMPRPNDNDDDDDDDPDTWLDADQDGFRPGWSVTPGGPICPSRELAELALHACSQLADDWTLNCVEDPTATSAPTGNWSNADEVATTATPRPPPTPTGSPG